MTAGYRSQAKIEKAKEEYDQMATVKKNEKPVKKIKVCYFERVGTSGGFYKTEEIQEGQLLLYQKRHQHLEIIE